MTLSKEEKKKRKGLERLKTMQEKRAQAWSAFKGAVWHDRSCAACHGQAEEQHHIGGRWTFRISDVKWYSTASARAGYVDTTLRHELFATVPICKHCHRLYHGGTRAGGKHLRMRAPKAYAVPYNSWLEAYVADAF